MKKILSVMLITVMILSCFSVVAFAEENYDGTWEILLDKTEYLPGDELVLTVVNKTDLTIDGGAVNFTYDSDALELVSGVTDNDETDLPRSFTITEDTTVAGEYICFFASDKTKEISSSDVILTVIFNVKEDIKGTSLLNFRWMVNSNQKESNAALIETGTTGDIKTYFNVNFVSASAKVIGENLAQEPQYLSAESTYVFSGKNETGDNIIEINGVKKSITSRYAVAYSKVAPRNDGVVKLAAGFILSKENSNLTLESKNIKIFEARNFGSDNMFTGLFYGPGLKAGETYYVIPYVTYTNGETLYASEAQSFTMPE